MKKLSNIKGVLCDIDGTLIFKGKAIPNAVRTIEALKEIGKKLLFLTNTDSKIPRTIYNILHSLGFDIEEHEIFTPIIALKEYIKRYSEKKIYLVSTEEERQEFREYKLVDETEQPDIVIISDFHDDWDVKRLNNAFRFILSGAQLFGTQGNRYYLDRSGEPNLDTGSFVELLSFSTGSPSEIFGKPSASYFLNAITKLKLNPHECIVIGDDINSDIKGAINARIKGILVKTGKAENLNNSNLKLNPYMILDSIASILKFL